MFEIIKTKLNGYFKESKEFSNLSVKLQDKLELWDNDKRDIKRLNWNTYFMAHAFLASTRSTDTRTKHGCVLVDISNTIISSGYNAFVRSIDERILPNYNEDKYPFMIHSEMNALLNAARQGKSTLNTVLYVTGLPCFNCLQSLYQAGISKIFYGTQYTHMMDNQDYKDNFELFKYLTQGKMPLINLDFNKEKLMEIINV